MKPTLYTATGECVTPGRELGKGGEGAVYDIEEFVDSVAKIYHTPPPALKQDKLAFMAATADAQLLNYVAWKTVVSNFYPDLDEAVKTAEKELESEE